jgi:hemerythrin-like domain-containing protein
MKTLPVAHFVDPEELLDPIGFMRTEHDEQREFCRRLSTLVDDLSREEILAESSSLLDFLLGRMALNMKAEENDLMPLMRMRCASEKMAAAVLNKTWAAHSLIALYYSDIRCGLECLSAGEMPEKPLDFIFDSLEFIDVVQRHVDCEDLVLLPLAECLLTTADVTNLGHAIAVRHGLPFSTMSRMTDSPFRSSETDLAVFIDLQGNATREPLRHTAWRHKKRAPFEQLH